MIVALIILSYIVLEIVTNKSSEYMVSWILPYVEKKVGLFDTLFVSYTLSYLIACFCDLYTVPLAWLSSVKHY